MNEKERIFLASPHMSSEGFELAYIDDAFKKNFIAPLGENVNEFEKELFNLVSPNTNKVNTNNAVALTSGTGAIHMALKALDVKEGDYVLVQSLTFSATVNPVTYVNAIPIFIDSDYETWNMCPRTLEKVLEKYDKLGKLPKAVIIVHLYGICSNLDQIVPICKKYNVPIIEDAAESLGTTYTGAITENKPQYTGTFGEYGIFSFNGNKIITTSGGGMLVCNIDDNTKAEERCNKIRFWSTQARENRPWYQHEEIGYNYRMSNIVAGIGRGQLKVLDQRVEKKQYIFHYYKKKLGYLEGLSFMPVTSEDNSNCWLSVIQIEETCKVKPLSIIDALAKDNIESRPVWKPMHLQPVFSDCAFYSTGKDNHLITKSDLIITDQELGSDNSISGTLFRNGVCLPSDTKMTDNDLDRICSIIEALWQ